eukprot:365195-Chlamydomonas_euryale.AAC.12
MKGGMGEERGRERRRRRRTGRRRGRCVVLCSRLSAANCSWRGQNKRRSRTDAGGMQTVAPVQVACRQSHRCRWHADSCTDAGGMQTVALVQVACRRRLPHWLVQLRHVPSARLRLTRCATCLAETAAV